MDPSWLWLVVNAFMCCKQPLCLFIANLLCLQYAFKIVQIIQYLFSQSSYNVCLEYGFIAIFQCHILRQKVKILAWIFLTKYHISVLSILPQIYASATHSIVLLYSKLRIPIYYVFPTVYHCTFTPFSSIRTVFILEK